MHSPMCTAAHVGPADDCGQPPSLLGSSPPIELLDFLILHRHYHSTVAVWCSGSVVLSQRS